MEEVLGDAEATGPNPQFMEEHLEGLLGGKIGALAKEIAAEAASEAYARVFINLSETKNTNATGKLYSRSQLSYAHCSLSKIFTSLQDAQHDESRWMVSST